MILLNKFIQRIEFRSYNGVLTYELTAIRTVIHTIDQKLLCAYYKINKWAIYTRPEVSTARNIIIGKNKKVYISKSNCYIYISVSNQKMKVQVKDELFWSTYSSSMEHSIGLSCYKKLYHALYM